MEILTENRQARPLPIEMLTRAAEISLLDLGMTNNCELSLLFVDDNEIAEINENFLGHTGPTNVISFAMQEGELPPELEGVLLGDIIISADTAAKEAEAAGIGVDERLLQLMLHGILHLCGYEHVNDEVEAKIMEKRGQELLDKVAQTLNLQLSAPVSYFTV